VGKELVFKPTEETTVLGDYVGKRKKRPMKGRPWELREGSRSAIQKKIARRGIERAHRGNHFMDKMRGMKEQGGGKNRSPPQARESKKNSGGDFKKGNFKTGLQGGEAKEREIKGCRKRRAGLGRKAENQYSLLVTRRKKKKHEEI